MTVSESRVYQFHHLVMRALPRASGSGGIEPEASLVLRAAALALVPQRSGPSPSAAGDPAPDPDREG